jgi:hypothetical protein
MSARRDVVEVITVGAPFAVFKLAVGVHLLQASAPALLGWPLIALGVTDLALNAGNGLTLALRRRRLGPICVLHGVVTRLRGPDAAFAELGLALDAGLAFVLVAAMIAAGQISLLPPSWLAAWNVAVILNVLGAGALRLTDAVRRASRAPHGAPDPRR